jgi:hypothetical protein
VFPEEDIVVEEPEEAEGPSGDELDTTISVLEGGVAGLEISRAVAEIESWEIRLEATGDPALQPLAENLGALRGLLISDSSDLDAAGPLLSTLGDQVQDLASGAGAPVAERLRRLGELLGAEGCSLSGGAP